MVLLAVAIAPSTTFQIDGRQALPDYEQQSPEKEDKEKETEISGRITQNEPFTVFIVCVLIYFLSFSEKTHFACQIIC